jgi:hypothetical protein
MKDTLPTSKAAPLQGGELLNLFFLILQPFITRFSISRKNPHAAFAAPKKDENPRFDMPRHVATLIRHN